jgi:hypothetical protein
MGTSQLDIRAIIKDYVIPVVIPIVVALIPFSPYVYNLFTEPDFHFIYEFTYKKNPVLEWNRQIDRMMNQLGTTSQGLDASSQDLLLRKIGKEIYNSLPAMVSEIGFKPMDSETVKVANISKYTLRNIRAHFKGCIGFDSYKTLPDTFGSAENRNLLSARGTDAVTIRYDSLNPLREVFFDSYSLDSAELIYYGADASQCKPIVEAEIDKGGSAKGKEVNLSSYIRELNAKDYQDYMRKENALKLFVFIILLYVVYQIRSLKKRITLSGRL